MKNIWIYKYFTWLVLRLWHALLLTEKIEALQDLEHNCWIKKIYRVIYWKHHAFEHSPSPNYNEKKDNCVERHWKYTAASNGCRLSMFPCWNYILQVARSLASVIQKILRCVLIFGSPLLLTWLDLNFLLPKCASEYFFKNIEGTKRRIYTWKARKLIVSTYPFL